MHTGTHPSSTTTCTQPSIFQLHFQSYIHWVREHATRRFSYTGVVQVSLSGNTTNAQAPLDFGRASKLSCLAAKKNTFCLGGKRLSHEADTTHIGRGLYSKRI
jgi:hypothetical protein